MRYIDADALYEKLYPLDLVDKRLYTINAKAVADAIANTPTADVVPKSEGWWLYHEDRCSYICSECEEDAITDYYGEPKFAKYCPNCGAKMKGGE